MPFDVFRKQMDVLFTCSQFQGLALHKCQNGVPENASWSWTPAELGVWGCLFRSCPCWCSIFALFVTKYAVGWILAGYEKQERQEGVNNYPKKRAHQYKHVTLTGRTEQRHWMSQAKAVKHLEVDLLKSKNIRSITGMFWAIQQTQERGSVREVSKRNLWR